MGVYGLYIDGGNGYYLRLLNSFIEDIAVSNPPLLDLLFEVAVEDGGFIFIDLLIELNSSYLDLPIHKMSK